ncbi:methylenetetrahydrofolate reductase [Desulfosporosinus sp. BG]|uniref:methylenetetrahydrofolate reductase n=1 Tax=Desulfosporosinus sp. BG TaxID=1633135 RepID=UPI00083A5434|nr:methylenetetrahydrofolate reductase [Desulfosporosinus sp. BG]ODA41355.1 5,10-methylenetetrahydrofolate reductase [Desulfosporosinus sp. BG]
MKNAVDLKSKFATGDFIYTTELGAIDGTLLEDRLTLAQDYEGLDAINVHDCPNANLRMNSVMAASILKQQLGIETIPHFTCRDRSLLGTQADLLGAHALGIRSILATTGDAPNHGPYKGSKGVYNYNSFELIKLITNLNSGKDANEVEIKGCTDFTIAATATPGTTNLTVEIERMKKKIEMGADFFQTQPIYDVAKTREFLAEAKMLGKPILLGVMPLINLKLVKFINNKMAGVTVPDEIIKQMEEGKSGLEIAFEFVAEFSRDIQGIHIYGMGDVQMTNKIIAFAKNLR